jgi:hypothetical protein
MDDKQIIEEPSAIERYTMCLEEQVATLTDALHTTQKELRELKSKVDTNMPLKPYHNLALEGCNLTDRYYLRLVSPQHIDPLFVQDYLKSKDSREFCMVSSQITTTGQRHVLELVGIFMDYVYLSNTFNEFYDEFKKAHERIFTMYIVSLDRVNDYMCARHNIFKKQKVVESYPKPQMYKYDEHSKKVECLDVEWSEPDPYFKTASLINPVIAFEGVE